MSNKVETFFEKVGAWIKARFSKAPAIAVQIASAANYLVPFIESLDALVLPEIAPVVNPILDKIKVGLGALATASTDATAGGQANVKSILGSLTANASALEAAFQVKDPATAEKITAVVQLINGEAGAISAQLGL